MFIKGKFLEFLVFNSMRYCVVKEYNILKNERYLREYFAN